MFKKVFIFLFISVNLHYVIAMMTGGKTFKSYNELDGEMRDKINYIINTGTVKFNEQVNSMYHYKVESPDDVIKIATQVVEGINYEVEVILKPTGCRKTPNKVDLEECTISQDGKPKKVSISLWERTWMPEPEKKQIWTIKEVSGMKIFRGFAEFRGWPSPYARISAWKTF